MKTCTTRFLSLVSTSLLLAGTSQFNALAADGTWINDFGGSWSDTSSWLNGTVADDTNSVADFSTLDITNTISVNLDPSANGITRNIGGIVFGDSDPGTAGAWILDNGGGGSLALGGPHPFIQVNDLGPSANNNTATIAADIIDGYADQTFLHFFVTTLVKTGPGPLVLNPPSGNTFSGGTIISNGLIYLSVSSTDLGTNPVSFYGGSLRLQDAAYPGNNPSVNVSSRTSFPNDIIVPTGQTGTIWMSPRPTGPPVNSGAVSGGGTLNMFVDYVRGNVGGDWTGFTGHLNVAASTRQNADFRFDTSLVPWGWSNNVVTITTNGINGNVVTMYNPGLPSGTVVEFGELNASEPGIVTVQATGGVNNGGSGSAPFVLQEGALNTDASFSGNFRANVGIIKVGTGTWTLTGDNSQTGIFVISNGVVQIGDGGDSGTIGDPSIAVTNYASLAFNRSGTVSVPNLITGPGSVVVSNGTGGTVAFTGANDYTGKTIIQAGTLSLTSESTLGGNPGSTVADQLTLDGGDLNAATNVTVNDSFRGVTVGNAGGMLSADASMTLTIANAIAGSGDLSIGGEGNVALTGANSYSGRTILSSGVLTIGDETALGANPGSFAADQLTLDGGTLTPTGNLTIDDSNRGVTLAAGGGVFNVGSSAPLTLATPITGSGALTKMNAGTLTLNAANTYTGQTLVNEGTLALGASGGLGETEVLVANGATFDVSAASGFTLGPGQTVSGFGTVAGTLTVAGGTISPGASVGTLTLSDLNLNGGTLAMEVSSTTGDLITVNGDLSLSGMTTVALSPLSALPAGRYVLLHYTGNLTAGDVSNLQLTGYPASRLTASLDLDTSAKELALVISGTTGDLTWSGTGADWDLSTANWLMGGSAAMFQSLDSVTFDATGSANPNVNLTQALSPGAVTVNAAADYKFSGSGKITGFASLTKSGSGTLTLATLNDNSGTTTISGGTVQVGDGTTAGSLGSGDIMNDATLNFNSPGSQTVAGAISGSGAMSVQQGTVALGADSSFGGATTIASGSTLQVGTGGDTGSLGTGSVTDNGALVFNRSGTVTSSGAIGGTGDLMVQGGGTVILGSDNSYSGATAVEDGTLQVGAGSTSGSISGTTLATVNTNGTLAFNRSDVHTNAVEITGNGALRQEGTGPLVIVSSNSYGATMIDSGSTLQISDGKANRFYEVVTTNADTTLTTNRYANVSLGTGDIMDDGTLVVDQAHPSTLANTIAGSGSLMQMGAGTLTIQRDAVNTYSGGTVISNATVILAAPPGLGGQDLYNAVEAVNGGGLGTGTITFLGNSTLQPEWATRQDPYAGIADTISNPINVPADQTGTIWAPGRYALASTVSGSGTLNLGVNYVRGDITGDWTNFTGRLNVISNAVNIDGTSAFLFRINNANGFPNTLVTLSNSVEMFGRANRVFSLGELAGSAGSYLEGPTGSQGANATWLIGGANTDATFGGDLRDANTIVKEGTGKWTLTGINDLTGTMTISNGVLALGPDGIGGYGSLEACPEIDEADPGVLDVTGLADGTLHLGEISVQTNGGNGTINGKLLVGSVGTISPGFVVAGTNAPGANIGTLTVSGDVNIQGTLLVDINATNSPNSDLLVAPSINADPSLYISTLAVQNLSVDDPPAWTTFKVTSVPVTGSFYITNLPPLINSDLYWSNRLSVDGTLVVASLTIPPPVSTSSNITFKVTGNSLDLKWDTAGATLQVQTNPVTVGLSNNWVDVPGSTATNRMVIPVDRNQGTVFYRLVP